MNDYGPEVYALIEDNHPSGYSIIAQGNGLWSLVYRCQIVRDNRTLDQVCEDVARYARLTDALA